EKEKQDAFVHWSNKQICTTETEPTKNLMKGIPSEETATLDNNKGMEPEIQRSTSKAIDVTFDGCRIIGGFSTTCR
ncbi:hypothetical protein O181_128072, partial [Austropuccinia psidii MF-1]|nr:hypothetical protein [Austropuccinia psidii MF-1]